MGKKVRRELGTLRRFDPEEISRRLAEEEAAEARFSQHVEDLRDRYAADVRQMFEVWKRNTDASAAAGQILTVLHRKKGAVEPMALRKLDRNNRAAALRLIDLCGVSFEISDDGLGNVLTASEVDELEDLAAAP